MIDLVPILTIAGFAVGTTLVEHLMERFGHGDKVVMVRVIGYGTAAYYSFRTWFSYLGRIAAMFGVYV